MGIEKIIEGLEDERARLKKELEEAKSKTLTKAQKYWWLGWFVTGFIILCLGISTLAQ